MLPRYPCQTSANSLTFLHVAQRRHQRAASAREPGLSSVSVGALALLLPALTPVLAAPAGVA